MNTNQEIFDFVLAAIRKQGQPSLLSKDGACAYRGEGGLKCAIGHLIPDESYSPSMEGAAVSASLSVRRILKEKYPGVSMEFFQALQTAHDLTPVCDGFLPVFEIRMKEIAEARGLQYKRAHDVE